MGFANIVLKLVQILVLVAVNFKTLNKYITNEFELKYYFSNSFFFGFTSISVKVLKNQ